MIFNRIFASLIEINAKLDVLIASHNTPVPAAEESHMEPPKFKLDDAKIQEGISNLMGYDPFNKKRGDEE